MAAGPDSGGVFERLYARRRTRYVDVLLRAMAVMIVGFMAPAGVGMLIPFFRISSDDVARLMGAFEVAVLIVVPGMFVIAHRGTSEARAWLARPPGSEGAAEAWNQVAVDLPAIVVNVLVWALVCLVAPGVYVGYVIDLGVLGTALYFVVLVVFVGGMGAFAFLFFAKGLRPMMAEAAGYLPSEFVPAERVVSLRAMLMVVLVVINVFTGFVVAAVSSSDFDPEGRLAATLTAAFGLCLTFCGVLALMVRDLVIEPLETLRQAMRRVATGDFTVRAPQTGNDELGDVTRSFNAMVATMREHDLEMRESRARVVVAGDAARRRVERDLHDGAQQQLVVVKLKLARLRQQVADDSPVAAGLDEAREEVGRALEDLRNLAHGLYPAVLESGGLPGALDEAAARAAVPVTVHATGVSRHARDVEAAVYFCCLEAVQNAAKHAGPGARVELRLEEGDGVLRFEVADDGAGFDAAAAGSGGVQNMYDRIGALGGTLEVASRPGGGTTVRGALPVDAVDVGAGSQASVGAVEVLGGAAGSGPALSEATGVPR